MQPKIQPTAPKRQRKKASRDGGFVLTPPVAPMLAKLTTELPTGEFLYEPKWDGFRALVFRSADDVYIQSRDLRPFDRYFPELHKGLLAALPPGCVVDGEIVVFRHGVLDFDALQQRIHPAASRIEKLAHETPAQFVVFDLLAVDNENIMARPQSARRERLEALLATPSPPLQLTPATRDARLALEWLTGLEAMGLDGVMAKRADAPYQPGKRSMLKLKHVRTADCVVAGFRWYKDTTDAIGSLLLGLYDARGALNHVGVTSSFSMSMRRQLAKELAPLRKSAAQGHPWLQGDAALTGARLPGGQSRWSAGKDLAWEPLKIERVCEVKYDHLQGDRFRHATTFVRWRPDKPPRECRYDQLAL